MSRSGSAFGLRGPARRVDARYIWRPGPPTASASTGTGTPTPRAYHDGSSTHAAGASGGLQTSGPIAPAGFAPTDDSSTGLVDSAERPQGGGRDGRGLPCAVTRGMMRCASPLGVLASVWNRAATRLFSSLAASVTVCLLSGSPVPRRRCCTTPVLGRPFVTSGHQHTYQVPTCAASLSYQPLNGIHNHRQPPTSFLIPSSRLLRPVYSSLDTSGSAFFLSSTFPCLTAPASSLQSILQL